MGFVTALLRVKAEPLAGWLSSMSRNAEKVVEVNSHWLEAMDPGSGKLYFIDLNSQQTSWDPPAHFMDRKQLAVAHCALLSDLEKAEARAKAAEAASKAAPPQEEDDEAFLAKVRSRFPPPSEPPPAESGTQSVAALEEQVKRLQAEKVELMVRLQQLEGSQVAATLAKTQSQRTVSQVGALPRQMTRGASKFNAADVEPPP